MREYGSEFSYYADCSPIQTRWQKYSAFHLLRCGRDAIFLAAKAVAEEYGIKKVYMPALACHSMFEAFQELGYTVIFYPIDSSFDYVLNEENYNQCLVFFMLY